MKGYTHAEFVVDLVKRFSLDTKEALDGAEVGVRAGDFSVVLLEAFPQLQLTGIDSYPEYQDGDKFITRDMQDKWKKQLGRNINKIKAKGRFELLELDSLEAAANCPAAFFDFLFLDACHDYKPTINDLVHWFPKVRDGGILCGHDFKWEGVEKAVREFTTVYGKKLEYQEHYDGGRADVWWLIK